MSTLTVPQAFETALQHHQAGRLAEAEALYRQILAVEPKHAVARHFLGVIAHQAGRHEVAAELIEQAIALDAKDARFHCNLGLAYAASGRLEEAVASYRRALELQPNAPAAHNNLGNALKELGRHDEAIAAYRRSLEIQPSYAEAHNNLGSVLQEKGGLEQAVAEFRQALAIKPNYPEASTNLGTALKVLGQLDEAVAAHRQALTAKPDYAGAWLNLGTAMEALARFDEAIAAYRRALELQPDFPEALINLANALWEQGQVDEALTACRRALELQPDFAEAHLNLGNVLKEIGRHDEAIAAYRRALKLKPGYVDAHNNLGAAFKDQGRLDEALAIFGHGVELAPARADLHSNLIYLLQVHPMQDERATREAQRRWNGQFAQSRQGAGVAHANKRDPDRRLRIGYVSPDFREHPVAFFFAPLLEAHDYEQFEIYCYSSLARPDAVTARLRQGADVWREGRGLSDAQLAKIREDGIDLLVDLAMHTSHNRLAAFAHEPAPVQVSWLAYPGNTGVEAIGCWLSDAHIDPVGPEESSSREQVVRLPDAWCCYAPILDFPPVTALPAANGRGVTFGSLNKFEKINEPLLNCWAGLLRKLPGARLLMICPAGDAQERTWRLFAEQGIAADRVELVAQRPWAGYLALFQRIDVALDTYPCNGMTTTCHALWMGVPVVTRAGRSAVSRAGLSLLHTIGLPELAAQSEEEYVRTAVELAGDLKRLAESRVTLRARMAASPLMDAPRFARNMEAAYRTLWWQWCSGRVL